VRTAAPAGEVATLRARYPGSMRSARTPPKRYMAAAFAVALRRRATARLLLQQRDQARSRPLDASQAGNSSASRASFRRRTNERMQGSTLSWEIRRLPAAARSRRTSITRSRGPGLLLVDRRGFVRRAIRPITTAAGLSRSSPSGSSREARRGRSGSLSVRLPAWSARARMTLWYYQAFGARVAASNLLPWLLPARVYHHRAPMKSGHKGGFRRGARRGCRHRGAARFQARRSAALRRGTSPLVTPTWGPRRPADARQPRTRPPDSARIAAMNRLAVLACPARRVAVLGAADDRQGRPLSRRRGGSPARWPRRAGRWRPHRGARAGAELVARHPDARVVDLGRRPCYPA